MKNKKILSRKARKKRIRKTIFGTREKPRLSVFRSNNFVYAQLIDDDKGATLYGLDEKLVETTETNKVKKAFEVGKQLAREAKKLKIITCVFDRNGFAYHGRVKAVCEGAREGGLII